MVRAILSRLRARLLGREDDTQRHTPLPDDVLAIVRRVQPFTMTSPERIAALVDSVRYVVRGGLPGAFAECGVWRGGSVMAMILALKELGVTDRDLYLYDTFEGMTAPGEHDRPESGQPAVETWAQAQREGKQAWAAAFDPAVFTLESVRETLAATGYPPERIHFVQGPVENTLPVQAPPQLALLRLDTDWYESTLHELTHLYPRVCSGGVLIVDDYGHWQGCRRAVDEYFARDGVRPVLLNRIDYTGRLAVKP